MTTLIKTRTPNYSTKREITHTQTHSTTDPTYLLSPLEKAIDGLAHELGHVVSHEEIQDMRYTL